MADLPSSEVNRDWYLIQSRPRQAERALEHLQRQAYHCYLPTRWVDRPGDCGRVWQEEALFPNYLFIQLSREFDNWMPIRSTRGVSRLVGFGNQPLRVPSQLIEQIRQRGDEKGPPPLREGDRVCITEGSFADLEAIFVAHDGNERVVLLIDLLQRENLVRFPLNSVRKL